MKDLNQSLSTIPQLTLSASKVFHKATKIKKLAKPLDPKEWPKIWTTVDFKSYPRYPYFKLPEPHLNTKLSFKEILITRRSIRTFSKTPLTLQDLSNLLFYSAGIKGESYITGGERFYPSAGARYPLEIYPLILNVKDLKPGIYHYYVKKHGLEELYTGDKAKKMILSTFNPDWVYSSSFILIISAVFYRTQIKYYERGYRHILAEVGFLSQNVYLVSTALGFVCCSLGGYYDDGLNKLIDLEEDVEAVVGAIALGR